MLQVHGAIKGISQVPGYDKGEAFGPPLIISFPNAYRRWS